MSICLRRREFIAALGGAAAWPLAAGAQQGDRVRRIGMLTAGGLYGPTRAAAAREELAKLGWVEGRSLQIDVRDSGTDRGRLATDAEELVNLRSDVIFAFTGAAARAARGRTRTIPIVFVGGGDPADSNLVGSTARPTSNVTGFANNFATQGGKWVGLLKQAAPRLTRVARVFDPELTTTSGSLGDVIGTGAAQLAMTRITMPVRNLDEIGRAITAFAAEPNGGLLITGAHLAENIKAILGLALQHRLPTLYGAGKLVAEGLLMSNGPDLIDMTRRASSYVDRILRGAKPSDLPVQYPAKIPLVINLKTAKAVGLEFPPYVLALADEVIE
jgi:putative ABC transport system substrate-binding protein